MASAAIPRGALPVAKICVMLPAPDRDLITLVPGRVGSIRRALGTRRPLPVLAGRVEERRRAARPLGRPARPACPGSSNVFRRPRYIPAEKLPPRNRAPGAASYGATCLHHLATLWLVLNEARVHGEGVRVPAAHWPATTARPPPTGHLTTCHRVAAMLDFTAVHRYPSPCRTVVSPAW